MSKQGEPKDPDDAKPEGAEPAKFEVKVDRSIAGAVSAGHGSKAEGSVTVQAIHAQNVYVMAERGRVATPSTWHQLFRRRPRITVQKTTTALALPFDLGGDLKVQYRGIASANLTYCVLYAENRHKLPIPVGEFQIAINGTGEILGYRSVAFPKELECRVDQKANSAGISIMFRHGVIEPGNKLLVGMVLSGSAVHLSDFNYEYRGDPAVALREKPWPTSKSHDWFAFSALATATFLVVTQQDVGIDAVRGREWLSRSSFVHEDARRGIDRIAKA